MIPIFTICMVIFIIVLKINLNKNNQVKEEADENFWKREREANFTRKKDISVLNYISIPLDDFCLDLGTSAEQELIHLSNEKILNLTGISNTDLKLEYGVANLELLSTYDNNFTRLVNTLAIYSQELVDANRQADARRVLEYAVSVHADSKQIYTLLAKLYLDAGQPEQIDALISSAEELNSFSKKNIIDALKSIQECPNCE